mmetsp:Transcript_110611/g.312812  ORF Transcript_110611/g.312812 Transcript_110611/m.312812 type:complete len:216 (-) Transcript_110611:61-708(-)
MGGSLSAELVRNLSSGLSAADAEKLWGEVDRNGDGVLDRKEAKRLVDGLVGATEERLREGLERLKEARSDPAQVDALLGAFDLSKDGNVAKEDFIRKAQEGYEIPLYLDDDEAEEQEEEEDKGPEAAKAEESLAEEPPKKKARVEGDTAANGGFKPGQVVRVVNVKTEQGKAFNGKSATVVRWDSSRGRWLVRLKLLVPTLPENLEAASQPQGSG